MIRYWHHDKALLFAVHRLIWLRNGLKYNCTLYYHSEKVIKITFYQTTFSLHFILCIFSIIHYSTVQTPSPSLFVFFHHRHCSSFISSFANALTIEGTTFYHTSSNGTKSRVAAVKVILAAISMQFWSHQSLYRDDNFVLFWMGRAHCKIIVFTCSVHIGHCQIGNQRQVY